VQKCLLILSKKFGFVIYVEIQMDYNLFRPWESLDPWQKEYIKEPIEQDNFLLCGRQVGKTTAMSIKAVELCVKQMKKGEDVLIASITEKQGYFMLAKALAYANAIYPNEIILKGKNKPTMHIICFKNGSRILSYAAGETGEGLRGLTVKKLMIDEGSRMSREFFIAVSPMLSVIGGSMDIASTPCGKEGFFYDCSKDLNFKQFFISAEECPRHTKEFLENEKVRLGKTAYAQEYLAIFMDEMRRIFSDEWIKEICREKRKKVVNSEAYLGVDVAGFGKDITTYEILKFIDRNNIIQIENIIERGNFTTQTSDRIINLNTSYNFNAIGIDDGGIGFGVYSELMRNSKTQNKTFALNNASRTTDNDGEKSKKLLKEEMYINLLIYGEQKRIKLLEDDEVKASLSSIQHNEEGKIYGSDSHIVEGIIRALWLIKTKGLNLFVHTF
jgi:hypothetical protein